jgi:hypothetical protein
MSSYSEYLGRKMQRTQQFIDTRPHRDAGHQTEVIKRLAAAGVQESKTPASAGVTVLNGPSTQVKSFYAKAHTVQDPSVYNAYTAGQAVAQSGIVIKSPQIEKVCYSASTMPDKQDILTIYPQEALKQAAKNSIRNCCTLCGEPIQYTTACPCTAATRRFTTAS